MNTVLIVSILALLIAFRVERDRHDHNSRLKTRLNELLKEA